MALSATHESTPVRRERLLFRGALAHALLALLGGASKRRGLDRGLKANTSKKRSLSLYRQRCFWYEAIPPWTTHASPSSRGSSMLFSKNREFTPLYSPHDDYDPELVALIPMGFCYPGTGRAGDKPPRPECAPLWHEPLLTRLPAERLEVIVGAYAQQRYVSHRKPTLTGTVANWAAYLPRQGVLPHPSPRNRHWLTKNPWFETETVPAARARIGQILGRRS